MATIKALVIGGSKDGHLLTCHEDTPPVLHVAVVEPIQFNEPVTTLSRPTFRREFYHLKRLGGREQTFYVWLLDGLTEDDMLHRLMAAYQQVSERTEEL